MTRFPEHDPLAHMVEIYPDGTPVKRVEQSHAPATQPLKDDAWVADLVDMKVPTIRSQRHKRKHGQKHWFQVDPVYIGSKPRYRPSEVFAWLKRQFSKRQTAQPPPPAAQKLEDDDDW